MTAASDRLTRFAARFEALIGRGAEEAEILAEGGRLLEALVAVDDWLPDAFAQPDPVRYTQYLLHRDPGGRFSVVSFVWGPGQSTPVHNHTVWGLIGVLRGAELSQRFEAPAGGGLRPTGEPHRLETGEVEAVSPRIGDIHQVANAWPDRTSISIHVYGADIGTVRRATFDAEGRSKAFISGYANAPPKLERPA